EFAKELSTEGLIFKDIVFREETLFSKEQMYDYFYSLDEKVSIPNRIQLVKEWLVKGLRKIAKKEVTSEWVEEEIQFLDKDEYLEAFNLLQKKQAFEQNTFNDFEREKKVLSR